MGRGRPRKNPEASRSGAEPAEEILRSASELFAKHGFVGTTTAAIAERAGLQQPSIFYYFGSKEEIFRTLADKAIVQPLEALRIITTDQDPAAVQLFRLIAHQVTHDLSEPYELSVVVDEAFRRAEEQLAEWHRATQDYTRGVRAIIEAGTENGEFVENDPFTSAMGILGMCNWSLKWYAREGRLSAAQVADDFARLSLRGLLADPARLEETARTAHAANQSSGLTRPPQEQGQD